jgi:hypothetical protein
MQEVQADPLAALEDAAQSNPATKAFNEATEAARVSGEEGLIRAGQHIVRTVGIDSNTPNTATPGSIYGASAHSP